MTSKISLTPVYIFSGDDTVGRERAKLKVIKSIIDAHGQVFHEKFDHSAGEFINFIESMLSPSLFQEIRIFQLNHAQLLSESDLKYLDNLLNNFPPDLFLIIEIDEEKKKAKGESKILKKLHVEKRSASKDQCIYQEFPKPPDYKIGQWLVNQVPALFDRSITKDDADFLVDLAGNDIDMLYSELQKIDIHLPPGKAVDHKSIEEIVGSSRLMTVFELATSLAERQFPRVLQIIDSLFSSSFFAPVMISALFRHFWALYRIRCFAQANPQVVKKFMSSRGFNNPDQTDAGFAIGRAAGLLNDGEQRKVYPVMIASGIVPQAKKFTDQELRLIFKWLLEFDTGVKTGKVEGSQQDVQTICYKIARVTELIRDGVAA
jgi:DNA polymerase III delta subunit